MLVRFDEAKKKWIEIPQEEKQEGDLYLDGKLKECLDHYKKMQRKDHDIVIVLWGKEGSGKSTLQGNILEYVSDGKFDPKKDLIGADYLDGLEKIDHAKQGGWIGFDEGNVFFLSTETMKREHRDLHKIFSIFRQKNLFVVICLPSLFRLGSYFAIDRSIASVRTYVNEGSRGFFAFHGRQAKDKLYRLGKLRNYDENIISPTFRGRFSRCYKMENEEYKSFKRKTLANEIEKAKGKVKTTGVKSRKDVSIDFIKMNPNIRNKEVAEMLHISQARVSQLKKEISNVF